MGGGQGSSSVSEVRASRLFSNWTFTTGAHPRISATVVVRATAHAGKSERHGGVYDPPRELIGALPGAGAHRDAPAPQSLVLLRRWEAPGCGWRRGQAPGRVGGRGWRVVGVTQMLLAAVRRVGRQATKASA